MGVSAVSRTACLRLKAAAVLRSSFPRPS